MPVSAVNSGRSTFNNPEFSVLVVVDIEIILSAPVTGLDISKKLKNIINKLLIYFFILILL
jgi:hypothetical protein